MSQVKTQRGTLEGQAIRNNNWRDSRTAGEKFNDSLENPNTTFISMLVAATIIVIYPALAEVTFILAILFLRKVSSKKLFLPFRMPKSSGLIDYNSPGHDPKKPFEESSGIMFLGNEMGTRKELWVNDSDARTHFLIFGSTGAGKALRNEEVILTDKGWVLNKNINVGDYVVRPTGEYSKVIGVYPQGISQLYDFELEDGRMIPITADHLWEVYDHELIIQNLSTQGEVLKTFDIQNKLIHSRLSIKTVGKIDGNRVKLSTNEEKLVYNAVLNTLNNIEFDEEILSLINGSYSQREFFFYSYQKELSNQIGYTIKHFNSYIFGSPNQKNAKFLQSIAHSLGFYAKMSDIEDLKINSANLFDSSVMYTLTVKEVDYIEIKSIITTSKFEECQCIKIENKDGLFVTKDYIVTHNTETLLSLAFNTLVHGSGFIYVDGKGDNSLFMKIFSMLRSMGREDDLLILNYMTGSRNVSGPQENKLSNTLNPFTTGTSNGLTELIVGLMGGGSGGGDGDMWKGRAISMIGAVMRALVWKRDNQNLLLDVEVLRDNILFENIQKLAKDTDLPGEVISSLNGYLQSVPGYVAGNGDEPQEAGTLEQHGFLMMQFTRILSSLSDDYGYIFKTNLGEIDFKDVILNNRVLCVLLPALEKSTDELANLGKIVVACIKIMMSAGLGDAVEGETKRLLDTKPTNSLSPYMCILDEYGYYVVTGAAVMPAQARSLGFSMVFAGQDYPSFKKNNNSEEASATIGNCNIKIFMKVEDPGDTFKLAEDSAGKETVSRATSQERSNGIIGSSYMDTQNISISKESKLDWLDLKSQTEGQAHVIVKDKLIRATMFYANPKKPKTLRLNHFVKVEPPKKSEMDEYLKPVVDLERKINNKDFIQDIISEAEDINVQLIGELIKKIRDCGGLNENEISAATIAANLKNNDAVLKSLLSETEESMFNNSKTKVNIYAEDDYDDEDDNDFNYDKDKFSISRAMAETLDIDNENPLIRERSLSRSVEQIEKYSSSSSDFDIKNKSNQFVNDVSALTSYPNGDIPNQQTESGLLDSLDALVESLRN